MRASFSPTESTIPPLPGGPHNAERSSLDGHLNRGGVGNALGRGEEASCLQPLAGYWAGSGRGGRLLVHPQWQQRAEVRGNASVFSVCSCSTTSFRLGEDS